MQKYDIHPELAELGGKFPFNAAFLTLAVPLMRLLPDPKLPAGLCLKRFCVPGYRGLSVKIELFEPENLPEHAPALLYFHGGGFGMAASAHHRQMAHAYALGAGCRVVFPDYHLLPRHPFPAAREDALAVWAWMEQNAGALGIDTARMAVGGDSAGGLLAIDVANLAAPHGLLTPCLQMLIYPVTDRRMGSESMRTFTDTPMWSAPLNRNMWEMYLKNTPENARDAACPAYTLLPADIAPAYLETAQFDPLRDEGKAYAERLAAAGGEIQLVETEKTIHGYDIAHDSAPGKENLARRIAALQAAFAAK